jgi:hypothetical protein
MDPKTIAANAGKKIIERLAPGLITWNPTTSGSDGHIRGLSYYEELKASRIRLVNGSDRFVFTKPRRDCRNALEGFYFPCSVTSFSVSDLLASKTLSANTFAGGRNGRF